MLDNTHYASISFLPDGRPAPAVLTAAEVAEFLRLDGTGQRALKFWRDTGLLRGVRLGKTLRYRLCDVEAFLDRKTQAESSSIGLTGRRSLVQNA